MKASIIVPAHNEETCIQACIESLLNNSYSNKEIIVVNDGSTDNTANILSNYTSIIVVNLPKKGMLNAIKEGVKRSSGDIILKIDADSIASKFWISKMIEHFNNPDIVLVGGTLKNKYFKGALSIGLKSLDEIYINILKRKLSVCKIMGANWAIRSDLLKDEKHFENRITDESIMYSIIKSQKGKVIFDNRIYVTINSPNNIKKLWQRKYMWGIRAVKDKTYSDIKFWIRPLYFFLLIISIILICTISDFSLLIIFTLPLIGLMLLSISMNAISIIMTPIVFLISELAFVFGNIASLIKKNHYQ